jgi:hypothetical protein
MSIFLWVLQILLAIKFFSVAFTHGLRPDETKMQRGSRGFGTLKKPLLILTAIFCFFGGIGLILPAVVEILIWLTPLTAAILAGMMLLSIVFHIKCCEKPNFAVSLILFALAGFVAYGRWILAPL